MYGAIVSPETGDIMAKAGMGMLVIPQEPWEEHRKDYDAYVQSCLRWFQSEGPHRGMLGLAPATTAKRWKQDASGR